MNQAQLDKLNNLESKVREHALTLREADTAVIELRTAVQTGIVASLGEIQNALKVLVDSTEELATEMNRLRAEITHSNGR